MSRGINAESGTFNGVNCYVCRLCCACDVVEDDHGDFALPGHKGDAQSYMDTEPRAIRELNVSQSLFHALILAGK